MNATLRPMNLGEILDRTFEIYRKRFWVFVGLAAMPAVAMLGVHIADILWWHVSALVHRHRRSGDFLWTFFVSICFAHIWFLLCIPIAPALVNSASKAAFAERDSVFQSLRVASAYLRKYIWVGVLKLLGALVVPEFLAVGLFVAIGSAEGAAGMLDDGSNLPFAFLFVVPLVIFVYLIIRLGACFSLAFQAAVFEGLAGAKALRRSWLLSRKSRGRIIAVWSMMLIFGWSVMAGMQLLFRWAIVISFGRLHLGWVLGDPYSAGCYVLNAIVASILSPLYPIAITLIYYDQRIRREGYDVEMMMEAAGLGVAGAPGGEVASIEAEPQETEA